MTAQAPSPAPAAARVRTRPLGRLGALARAEVTLLGRNRGTLFTALVLPFVMPLTIKTATENMDLEKEGLSVATVLIPAAMGFSLLFAVYTALVTTLVARREELVLKRLRTGELSDSEILAGTSVPAAFIGLAQCLLVAVGATVILGTDVPEAPHLALLGLVLGLLLCPLLAAVTAAFTRTVESAGVTAMPVLLVTMIASGVAVPLEVLPDKVSNVFELLPLTPVMTLIRGGWTGDLGAGEVLKALVVAVVWIALTTSAVGRWFRWEPRH